MLGSGLLKDTNKKKKNAGLQKSQPLHIRLNPEADLYIGKNNKQNDYVTLPWAILKIYGSILKISPARTLF